MAGDIGPAKCLRCGSADAIEIRDDDGWEVGCQTCGFFEIYANQGERRGYRRECPVGFARYISKKERQGLGSGVHKERFFSEKEAEEALAHLRSLMESGEVYWQSVLVTIWREGWQAVEFMMGGPECLRWEAPVRADVPLDPEGPF
jgi:hypothetical protein